MLHFEVELQLLHLLPEAPQLLVQLPQATPLRRIAICLKKYEEPMKIFGIATAATVARSIKSPELWSLHERTNNAIKLDYNLCFRVLSARPY